ncbi:MAG: DNA-directed RNA polymerase subunit alpha C-terminal domain-containing protein [Phycisphaerae bacterium]
MTTVTIAVPAVKSSGPRDISKAKTLYEQAMKLVQAGKIPAAAEKLEAAYAADPDNEEVAFRCAYYADLLGDDELALTIYETMAQQQPTREGVLLNLSVIYEDNGYYDEAEECLHRLLSEKPNNARGKMYYEHVDSSMYMDVPDDMDRRILPRNLLLELPITDFELSVRARNCLKKVNIRTLGDLVRTTEAELASYKNFGDNSLVEIREMLAKKGLRLGQAAEEARQQRRAEIIRLLIAKVPEAVLNKPVSEINLSVRAIKALGKLEIKTVADLACRTEAELMAVDNFGQTSLDEVNQKLKELNLTLRSVE